MPQEWWKLNKLKTLYGRVKVRGSVINFAHHGTAPKALGGLPNFCPVFRHSSPTAFPEPLYILVELRDNNLCSMKQGSN